MNDSDTVATLIRWRGPRTAVPPEITARVRARTRESWRASCGRRRRRRLFVRAMIASGLAAGLAALAVWRPPPLAVASVLRVEGSVLSGSRDLRALAAGSSLSVGERIMTGRGRLALTMAGHALRVDRGTTITLVGLEHLELETGAVYVARDRGSAALLVETPWSRVRDVGTRFLVTVSGARWSVAVAEGEVVAETTKGTARAGAGQALRAEADGDVRREPAREAEWRWVRDAAPPPAIEGEALEAFLDWVRREAGWEIVWRPEALEAETASTSLHGSIEGLPFERAVREVLSSCGLSGTITEGVLEITVADDSGS